MTLPPEFSRLVPIAKLGSEPRRQSIEATAAEREALARRFDLIALDRLVATVDLVRAGADYRLDATFAADLVQACVVTLGPVPSQVGEGFTLLYRPGIDEDEADRLALENPEGEIVEPLMGDAIDIGEAVAQQLSVAMDPYPRAPAVSSGPGEDDSPESDEAAPGGANPFDVLARLKRT